MSRALTWIAYLWPGLSGLWLQGRWDCLVTAILFGLALNFALLTTALNYTLTFLPPAVTPVAAWILVLGFWVAGSWLEKRGPLPTASDAKSNSWFQEAQTQYLKGHWIEAETLLAKLLDRQPADIEARLLLASVQRRTGRLSDARTNLQLLSQAEAAAAWSLEIQTEQNRIHSSEQENSTSMPETENPPLARAA